MKFSLIGLVRLKPFEESVDGVRPGAVYAKSGFFTLAILLGAALNFVALGFALARHPEEAIDVLCVAIAVSAVTAGMEWNSGLRARALNQLVVVLVVTLAITLLR